MPERKGAPVRERAGTVDRRQGAGVGQSNAGAVGGGRLRMEVATDRNSSRGEGRTELLSRPLIAVLQSYHRDT